MTNFISTLVLNQVILPDTVQHIDVVKEADFQLLKDAFQHKKPIGFLVTIEGIVKEFGTLAAINNLYYDDVLNKYVVAIKGMKPFKVLELVKNIPEKKYGGAIVNYPPQVDNGRLSLLSKIAAAAKQLHYLLESPLTNTKAYTFANAYEVANVIAMPLTEQYLLLTYNNEIHRQEAVKRYLIQLLPVALRLNILKRKLQKHAPLELLDSVHLN